VAEIEGKDNTNSKDKLGDAFKALLADISKEEEQYSDSFFTSVKSLLTKSSISLVFVLYAKTLVDNLNN
jgi:hypothetical protein